MRAIVLLAALTFATAASLEAQWQLQDSRTTADLRGIDNVGKGVAWASGSDGTILRTEDAGLMWQLCAKPPGGEHLDFRAIQAFDNNTAIVMSSGKGDQSRLYKTTDGCQTWKLVLTNPDKDGFWDALQANPSDGILLGDPVKDHFTTELINLDNPKLSRPTGHTQARARAGEGAFAASNSSLFVEDPFFTFWFGTGGPQGARIYRRTNHDFDSFGFDTFTRVDVPIGSKSASSGVFSLAFRPSDVQPRSHENGFFAGVAVGGDYKAPNKANRTAVWTDDGGKTWTAAITPPHGFRSAVAYDVKSNTWITVGPNGTDISTDDGHNWRALRPDPKFNDAPDADQHWNALSLPFVVGPHGRIGTLRPPALK
ncbi:MAG TPA: hypothetical protein VIJ65_02945 [Acidobacteriaceae bacterium]